MQQRKPVAHLGEARGEGGWGMGDGDGGTCQMESVLTLKLTHQLRDSIPHESR